ncbi:MAG: OmpA family protein [Nitrospirota bacterium]|nr:OmpA family protein [Nitrospirota bacterium]
MMKRSPATVGILLLSVLVTFGCSAFHEVSVVSHGDEVAKMEKPVPARTSGATSASPVVVSDFPQLEPEEGVVPTPVIPIDKPIPITPRVASPSAKDSGAKDFFAQSAEDSVLPWTLQDVFFDYDRRAIRKDAIPILEQNAKVLLKRYPNREVLIQGHCDERGTEEYNLILGERRARAVKNYLIDLGVKASQMRVLSLGKSQPFCPQRSYLCFGLNRRAHFVLK